MFCLTFTLAVGKGEDGGLSFSRMPAGMSAAYSLVTGEAQAFHAQMLERTEICRSAPGEDVVLPARTAESWLLAYENITADPADWKNTLYGWRMSHKLSF